MKLFYVVALLTATALAAPTEVETSQVLVRAPIPQSLIIVTNTPQGKRECVRKTYPPPPRESPLPQTAPI